MSSSGSVSELLHRFVYAYTALAITGAILNLRIYVCAGAVCVLCAVCVCVCVCVCVRACVHACVGVCV